MEILNRAKDFLTRPHPGLFDGVTVMGPYRSYQSREKIIRENGLCAIRKNDQIGEANVDILLKNLATYQKLMKDEFPNYARMLPVAFIQGLGGGIIVSSLAGYFPNPVANTIFGPLEAQAVLGAAISLLGTIGYAYLNLRYFRSLQKVDAGLNQIDESQNPTDALLVETEVETKSNINWKYLAKFIGRI